MTITGISGDLYYINNPILISIKDLSPNTVYLNLWVANLDTTSTVGSKALRIYPNTNNEVIDLDLSEVLKANFTRPKHPTSTLVNGTAIGTNYIRFNILIQEIIEGGIPLLNTFSQNKTFIRGGINNQEINISGNVGDDLKETPKHLSWGGLPFLKYYIDNNRRIAVTNAISGSDIKQMKLIGCNPFYIRFLNTKGGYSYWLFPVWEHQKKTKNEGFVKRPRSNDSFSLGYESEDKIKAESRIKKEDYGLADALMESQEIYVYNKFGSMWSRIELTSGSFVKNTYEDIADLNAEFNLNFNNDPRLIW